MNRIILLLTMLSVSVYAADNDQAARNRKLLDAICLGETNDVWSLLNPGADIDFCGEGITVLHLAAELGHIDIVRGLVGRCLVGVNAKDAFGETPLHDAAKHGYLEIVRFLLESGAGTGAKNDLGETPADLAQGNGHDDVVQLIHDHENTPDIKEPDCD